MKALVNIIAKTVQVKEGKGGREAEARGHASPNNSTFNGRVRWPHLVLRPFKEAEKRWTRVTCGERTESASPV